jgi:type I restriction enzyme S subunit
MSISWPSARLGSLVSFKTGKLDSNAAIPGGEYPFFTCSQETLRTGTFSFDGEFVLLAGNNANGIYPLKYFNGKFDAYQRTYVIRSADPDRLLPRFLYYALRPKLEMLRRQSTGAATKFLTLTILNDLTIGVPPLSIQRRIASILAACDDLIENGTRRTATLEGMARLLFEEWFINLRAVGSPKGTPGFRAKNWDEAPLGEALSCMETGRRPKGGASLDPSGVPSIGAENVRKLGSHDFDAEKYVPEAYFTEMDRGIVQDSDVALYKDGAYIGRSTMFREAFPHARCCVNEHVFLLRPNARLTPNYLYLWLQRPSTVAALRASNSNAAQPGLNQRTVSSMTVLVPDRETLERFDRLVEPIFAEIVCLAKRNRVLARARDLLLPGLISGEVDVSKLELAA